MHKHYLSTAALMLASPRIMVTGQEAQGAQVQISSCSSLTCGANQSNSVCSHSHQSDDVNTAPLVGIAESAVNLTADTKLSLTIIEEGRTIFSNAPAFEAYERTLYAGIPPSLFSDNNSLPAACALMLQYGSQTFPLPKDGSARSGEVNHTTSCAGVLDQSCFDTLATHIKSFNSSSNGNNMTNCAALAEHVSGQIHSSNTICSFYSGLISVTGAPLYNTSQSGGGDNAAALADDMCIPVLPASNSLYRVGSVQTIVEPDDRVGSDVFGGRQGFTPVVTVVYDGAEQGGNVSSVQFACMQGLLQSGLVLDGKTSASSSLRGDVKSVVSIAALVAVGFILF
ncbi:hypothetical protein F4777DRAFT_566869 [Nemania sp. FL0916]|nr:hypothetical protein F4777DRAFT_566869 [Nemania sp. FL0916]